MDTRTLLYKVREYTYHKRDLRATVLVLVLVYLSTGTSVDRSTDERGAHVVLNHGQDERERINKKTIRREMLE